VIIIVEIVFSDSACGSLIAAQHYGEGEFQEGSIAIFVYHEDGREASKEEIEAAKKEAMEKSRLSWEAATPMGGKSADVYGFSLRLSVGDISEEQPGIKRKQTLERSYSAYPRDEGHQAAQELFQRASESLIKVQERASAGEPVRIWYSNQPDEMCGLYWFMEQLDRWELHDGQISIVKLPELETRLNGIVVRKNSWGEMAPEEWHRHLELQQLASPIVIQSRASHWRKLREENSPLRAAINGQLVSVPENFYDDFILRELTAVSEVFHEVMLIGRLLGKGLGIGDFWIASRIEEMINAGTLEIISEAAEDMPRYHRMLKKRDH